MLRARATARRDFAHRWLHDGAPVPGSTGAQLRFDSLTLQDGGEYACEAFNRWGVTTSQAALLQVEEVGGEPYFVEHPRCDRHRRYCSSIPSCLRIRGGMLAAVGTSCHAVRCLCKHLVCRLAVAVRSGQVRSACAV